MDEMRGLLGKKKDGPVQKQLTNYTTPLEDSIKEKLYKLAGKGYSSEKPTLITIDEITRAIQEHKTDNQIFTNISIYNCVELALSFKKILKIANLDNLTSLQKLKLDNNMIMKIEHLDHLVQLKWLDLSFNNISKIEGLTHLVNLTDISLFSNEISEIEGLENCRKLNILSIGRNKIVDTKRVCYNINSS